MASYAGLGVGIQRVMTDNGSCYHSVAFRDACQQLGVRHIRTRPYTPKTNGKAERFIQSSLREWAYAQPYAHRLPNRSDAGSSVITGIGLSDPYTDYHSSAGEF